MDCTSWSGSCRGISRWSDSDNWEIGSPTRPAALTTIDMKLHDLGRAAAEATAGKSRG